MVAWPATLPIARPVAAPTEAMPTPGATETELQAMPGAAVTLRVDPSLYIAVAIYCWVPRTGIEAAIGVTMIDCNVTALTFNVAVAVMPPKAAVMSDVTLVTPTATPVVGETVATAVVPEVQLEDAVTSRDEPSLYIAVAVNCWKPVIGIKAVAGVTAMDIRLGWPGNQCPVDCPPHPVMKKTLRIKKINKR
jgi:hypothetical protein